MTRDITLVEHRGFVRALRARPARSIAAPRLLRENAMHFLNRKSPHEFESTELKNAVAGIPQHPSNSISYLHSHFDTRQSFGAMGSAWVQTFGHGCKCARQPDLISSEIMQHSRQLFIFTDKVQ